MLFANSAWRLSLIHIYADMPDTPTGSYIGSYGLPVATGETKIGLSAWDADLVQGSYLLSLIHI